MADEYHKIAYVKPAEDTHSIKVIAKKPFKNDKDKIKWLYRANQDDWEKIGFPSDWNNEHMWEAFKKIYDQLDLEQKNLIMEDKTVEQLRKKVRNKNFRANLQERLWRLANKIEANPFKRYNIDISKTDGDETHGEIRTVKGRQRQEKHMKTIEDEDTIKEMLKTARAKAKQKRGKL